MVWPNLALVLPLSLPSPSSRAFPSSCIINESLILVRYKLGKLRKCWSYLSSSHPLKFVVAVGHPPLQKRVHRSLVPVSTRDIVYSKSQCHASARNNSICFRTAVRTIGGRLRTSTMFRTVQNLTDARTTTIVRLWYGNKLLTATVAPSSCLLHSVIRLDPVTEEPPPLYLPH